MDKRLKGNIYLVHSPDECAYYLERRSPGDWAISQSFCSEQAAELALSDDSVEWESI